MSTKKTPKNDPKWAHLTTPKNYKLEELQRYQQQVGGGGWTIKIMTFGLFGATAYFTYILHSRKRLPWQHNEKVSPRCRNNLALPCTLSLHDLCLVSHPVHDRCKESWASTPGRAESHGSTRAWIYRVGIQFLVT